ncbi:MAG TPA: hypothetical protein VFZ68_15370 [Acidimicrobiales bacterium]
MLQTAARASLARLRDEAARRRAEADPEARHPIVDQYFHSARREGRREDREAYAFDALLHRHQPHPGRCRPPHGHHPRGHGRHPPGRAHPR